MKKLMIAGYGSAGQYVLDFILKDHRINHLSSIKVISRKTSDEVKPRLDISRVAAGLSGRFIPVEYESVDFNSVDSLSEVVSKYKPDIIIYTGRYAPGLKYGAFSYPNQIGYGVWMPLAFPYIYNLMKAVRLSESPAKVVNTSFPDGINYLLGQIGLKPYTGAGNINHLIPRLKFASKSLFRSDPSDFDVNFVCSHYANTYISKEGTSKDCPTLLTIRNKVTGELCYDESPETLSLKQTILSLCKDNTAGGPIRNQMIATDCAEIVRLLTEPDAEGETIHVPGFNGQPGGFRVKVCNGEFVEDVRPHWNPADVVMTNLSGLKHDGVVIRNGIRFTEESRCRMKEVFNFDYPEYLEVDSIKEFADTLRKMLQEVVSR